jgi:transcriptional regulator of acetoin/glycerol metabolism
VLSVSLPPLRARKDDIEELCEVLCRGLHPEAHVTEAALEVLSKHSWPGNIRELRNVLTRAYVLGGARIDDSDLSFHDMGVGSVVLMDLGRGTMKDAQRGYIAGMLKKHRGNRSAAAREMGIARSTLHYKMKTLGLS